MLLDEPFSALDPALRAEMLSLVDELCQTRHITLLMVSHNLDDALRIAPRSLVINEGNIVWDGETARLAAGEVAASALLGIAR